MVTAALDTGDVPLAHEHLQILKEKFPSSQRVQRLEGMRREAEGDFAGAGKVYQQMLAENPANSLARKRMVGALGLLCFISFIVLCYMRGLVWCNC